MYSFNPLIPLVILSSKEHANLDRKIKAEFVKELHAKVGVNIERNNEQYAKQSNKGCAKVTFELVIGFGVI